MRFPLGWRAAAALACLLTTGAYAQTQLLTNGSFESGLAGWTTATHSEAGAAGTCSYNGVVAPGTETLTSAAGFPATDGTHTLLGSVADTAGNGALITCVLYQDVTIPAGATTATISFDVGFTNIVAGVLYTAARVGIWSTGSVPGYYTAHPMMPGLTTYSAITADATLQPQTVASFNVSSLAGQTVRFAILNAATGVTSIHGSEVIGVDNVKFTVTTAPAAAAVPLFSNWTLAAAMLLLAGVALSGLRRTQAE